MSRTWILTVPIVAVAVLAGAVTSASAASPTVACGTLTLSRTAVTGPRSTFGGTDPLDVGIRHALNSNGSGDVPNEGQILQRTRSRVTVGEPVHDDNGVQEYLFWFVDRHADGSWTSENPTPGTCVLTRVVPRYLAAPFQLRTVQSRGSRSVRIRVWVGPCTGRLRKVRVRRTPTAITITPLLSRPASTTVGCFDYGRAIPLRAKTVRVRLGGRLDRRTIQMGGLFGGPLAAPIWLGA